jgi:osmotically-inducible protein OsmY
MAACLFSGARADEELDERIRLRITTRMAGQVTLNLQEFDVQVFNGVATLIGSVASVGERRHVERLVKGVVGVEDVRNNLIIRPAQRGELGIQSDISVLLERRTKFREKPIEASVTGTEVTLTGETDRALDSLDAENLAAGVAGVTRVINRIQLVGPASSNPDVAERVRSILVNPLTFGVVRDLSVEVKDGIVTLSGMVEREGDWDDAARLALSVPGVTAVNNQLVIVGR